MDFPVIKIYWMGYSVSREAYGMSNHLYSGGRWRVISVEENKNIVRSG